MRLKLSTNRGSKFDSTWKWTRAKGTPWSSPRRPRFVPKQAKLKWLSVSRSRSFNPERKLQEGSFMTPIEASRRSGRAGGMYALAHYRHQPWESWLPRK